MKQFREKEIIKIGGDTFKRGQRKRSQIEVASLYDYTKLNIPLEVIRGKKEGPVLFISGAIHGDEINGVEIVKEVLHSSKLRSLKGTLIAVPVVNVFGFNAKSRYLPDRRDLNRCFPGNPNGSLGTRLAHIFMEEIVEHCSHGMDFHTGAIHRSNLPQIRASLDDEATQKLAKDFGATVILDSKLRDGSLREAAREHDVKTLLYEGGEALRRDDWAIKSGVKGCLSVMRSIGMLPPSKSTSQNSKKKESFVAKDSYWVRASRSGTFHARKRIGDHVKENEVLGIISDPFGRETEKIFAEDTGIVIGQSTLPLVNKGDAILHLATFSNAKKVHAAIELMDEELI